MDSAAGNETGNGSTERSEGRGRSTVDFPYGDLSDAVEVAHAVHQVGGVSCSWDQLAAKMGQSPKGGGFRLRVSAARTFELLSYERGEVNLTDLGLRAIDPIHSRAAQAEAFLRVELFRLAYERFKGAPLPPAAAIERQFEQMGVAPKQKDKARHVFMRSAKIAGYFELSADRLVAPPLGTRETASPEQPAPKFEAPEARSVGGTGGGNGGSGLHPFIKGLLEKLPAPDSEFATAARVKWLQTAANIFDLMYQTPGSETYNEIAVTAVCPPMPSPPGPT